MQMQYIGNESDSTPKVACQQIEIPHFYLAWLHLLSSSLSPSPHYRRYMKRDLRVYAKCVCCENASVKAAQIDFAGTMCLSLAHVCYIE